MNLFDYVPDVSKKSMRQVKQDFDNLSELRELSDLPDDDDDGTQLALSPLDEDEDVRFTDLND